MVSLSTSSVVDLVLLGNFAVRVEYIAIKIDY